MLMPDVDQVAIEDRLLADKAALSNGFKRFAYTETGVSPMSLPGMPGGEYVAPGLEHDELGHVDKPLASHAKMMPKRGKKIEVAQQELEPSPRYGAERAEIGVIGWGSTEGAIREAVERAAANGIAAAAVHPKVLSPLPLDELREFASSVKRVIVPELNYSGQFARHLRSELLVDVVRLNKYSGVPFTAGEIYRKIEEVARG
jgi:2-oxoglutarate ferredoxin oxidoreductase subunit alpha